jgi:hypothetical protein
MTAKTRIPDEKWWDELSRRELSPQYRLLLEAGLQAWRRRRANSRRIDHEGLTRPSRYKGVDRVYPLLTAEVAARAAVFAALRELAKLWEPEDDDPDAELDRLLGTKDDEEE